MPQNCSILRSNRRTTGGILGRHGAARATWTDERLDDLSSRMEARFDSIERRFDSIDRRFDSVDRGMEARFDSIDRRLDALQRTMILVVTAQSVALIGVLATSA